jgi:hypothetical protein
LILKFRILMRWKTAKIVKNCQKFVNFLLTLIVLPIGVLPNFPMDCSLPSLI